MRTTTMAALLVTPWLTTYAAFASPSLEHTWMAAALLGLALVGWMVPRAKQRSLAWACAATWVGGAILATDAGRRIGFAEDDGSWGRYDLRTEPFSRSPPRYVEVTGFFHADWTLDEYRLPAGEHPDQSEAPHAILIPFVGARTDVLHLDGPVVIARVLPDAIDPERASTLRGEVQPLRPELREILVQIAEPTGAPEGVLVDTLSLPDRGRAWVLGAIGMFLCALASVGAWVALGTGRSSARGPVTGCPK